MMNYNCSSLPERRRGREGGEKRRRREEKEERREGGEKRRRGEEKGRRGGEKKRSGKSGRQEEETRNGRSTKQRGNNLKDGGCTSILYCTHSMTDLHAIMVNSFVFEPLLPLTVQCLPVGLLQLAEGETGVAGLWSERL